MLRIHILILLILLPWAASWASVPAPAEAEIFTYYQWKAKLVMEAHNKAVRLGNKMRSLELQQERGSQVNSKELKSSNKQYLMATEMLEITKEMSFQNYVSVYLPQFQNSPEALKGLVNRLPADQVAELVALLMKRSESQVNSARWRPKPLK